MDAPDFSKKVPGLDRSKLPAEYRDLPIEELMKVTQFEDLPPEVQAEDELFRVKFFRGELLDLAVEGLKEVRRKHRAFYESLV